MANLPSPFSDIPRVKLLFDRPADIEVLDRLSKRLNSGITIWMKREDCSSGLAFGGNKLRKLEYVLADALAQGADTLVTTGGIQSNHMRQTSAAAARLGLQVALYPRDAVTSTEAEYAYAGNVQLNHILGAETFPVGTEEEEVLEALKSRGRRPYSIPPGASLHPLGGLGYARWAFEVLEQEKQLGVTFDTIITTSGSGSTIGGMIVGFKLAQKHGLLSSKKRIIGFSVMRQRRQVVDLVMRIARTAAVKVGLQPEEIQEDDFEIDDSYIGPAYGALDVVTAEAIKELATTEGILTDPVYTGKAFAGLLGKVRNGDISSGNILFCHTGGQPAICAYPQLK